MWALVRFIHVLTAMAWVGGQLLLSLLVLPVLRRRLDPASRAPLTREVGVRFGLFTVAVFLPLQLPTGRSETALDGRPLNGRHPRALGTSAVPVPAPGHADSRR
jgi:hypothetical protein